MNIKFAGLLATSVILSFSILLVLPPYMSHESTKQPVLLSFTIKDQENTSKWCGQLSEILETYDAKAAIFLSGSTAIQHTDCVTIFSDGVDIGSQGYHYVSIPTISDYSLQLEEIQKGKQTIDAIGNFDSKLFKSPYGDTDQNIYSLLERSEILADFSYENQYNKFHDGQFIWFQVKSFDGSTLEINDVTNENLNNLPIIINFENDDSIEEITKILSSLKNQNIVFVSASELVGFDLLSGGSENV